VNGSKPFDFSELSPEEKRARRLGLEAQRVVVATHLAALDAEIVELRRAEVGVVGEVVSLPVGVDRQREQQAERITELVWPLVQKRNRIAEIRPGPGRKVKRIERVHVKAIEVAFACEGPRKPHALQGLSGVPWRICAAYLKVREEAVRRGILPIAEIPRN
jgi:hypothetical protein